MIIFVMAINLMVITIKGRVLMKLLSELPLLAVIGTVKVEMK